MATCDLCDTVGEQETQARHVAAADVRVPESSASADQEREKVVLQAIGRKGQDGDVEVFPKQAPRLPQRTAHAIGLKIVPADVVEDPGVFKELRGLSPHGQCGDVIVRAGGTEIAQRRESQYRVANAPETECQDSTPRLVRIRRIEAAIRNEGGTVASA